MSDDVRQEDLDSSDPRTAAVARLRARRHLRDNAILFAALTAFFVVIWAISGAGYFWPAWIVFGFACALGGEAWALYGRKPITEEQIQQEMAAGR